LTNTHTHATVVATAEIKEVHAAFRSKLEARGEKFVGLRIKGNRGTVGSAQHSTFLHSVDFLFVQLLERVHSFAKSSLRPSYSTT
jgi:hypothetical protein